MAVQTVYRQQVGEAESAAIVGRHELTGWQRVSWSAIILGALSALAATMLLGLLGLAIGAHQLSAGEGFVHWRTIGIGALAFSVFSAFLAFVAGGWIAGRIAGGDARETSLHGLFAWLIAVPVFAALIGVGAGTTFGAWYAGLADSQAARNSASAALVALLLGFTGSWIGGRLAANKAPIVG